MKNIFVITFALITNLIWSQYCPFIGPDLSLPCGVTSATLTADLSQCGGGQNPNQTTNYQNTQIPFVNQTNNGTSVIMTDDSQQGPFPIGFNFCFFGNTYNQFYIGSNGWISFSPNQPTTYTSANVPSAATPVNSVLGVWQDWHPGIGGQIRYQTQGVAPCRKLVVSWINMPMFSCTNLQGTFHIVLYESTNVIEVHILNKPNCTQWANGTATQAVQNSTGTQAVVTPGRNSTQWTTSNDGRRWTPSGPVVTPTPTWYQVGNPVAIGTGLTITVNPPQPGAYYTCHLEYPTCYAGWSNCNGQQGLGPDTIFVQPGPPNLPPPIINLTNPTCNLSCDGTIDVIPQGGNGVQTISWTGGQSPLFNQTGLCAGQYSFTITDAAGCSVTSNATLIDPPVPVVSTITSQDTICVYSNNEILSVVSNPGWTYQWSSDGSILSGNGTSQINADFSNLTPNQWYTTSVVGYNQSGCPSLPVTVSSFTLQVIPVITQIGPFCSYDNCQDLTATPLGGIFLGDGVFGSQFCPQNSSIFNQVDYIYDQSGCQFISSITVTVNPRPEILEINPDNAYVQICDGLDSTTLSLQVISNMNPTTNYWLVLGDTIETNTYNGSFGEGITQVGAYIVSAEGCVSLNQTTTVNVVKCPEIIYYVPNTFTPDGDEHNQVFEVVFTSGFDPNDFHLEIWNRWGELIWESYDHTDNWDGTYNGSVCQSGVYLWKIKFGNEDNDGSQLLYGHVNILR